MADVFIKLENIPSITEFIPSEDASLPTEAQLGIGRSKSVDNFSPQGKDPVNWMIFDPGQGNAKSPSWCTGGSGSTLSPVNPGASFPTYKTHGTNSVLYSAGGPRDKGYAEIGNKTWLRSNVYVAYQNQAGQIVDTRTETWKEGSIEFTIRPTSANCTLVSGSLFGDYKKPGAQLDIEAKGKQVFLNTVTDGMGGTQKIQQTYEVGPLANTAYYGGYVYEKINGLWYIFPDANKGIALTNLDHAFRTFKTDIVNGVIRVSYEIHYGDSKKYVEFYGKTNIVDNKWHHVVINRPSPFTIKDGENEYGGEGCIEIWVDGKLENRSFDITSNDTLPNPQILFNSQLNAGILNYYEQLNTQFIEWLDTEIQKTNYTGGIRDFVFRQSLALTPHLVNLNYTYALLDTDNSPTIKAKKAKASVQLVKPTVSTSKPKILKLYWNNLLSDKEKCLDGLEFDENYQVYSYSVTKKNINSKTQTFNLDLNDSTSTRFFLPNVKSAIGKNVFIGGPAVQLVTATDGASIDTTNEAAVSTLAVAEPNFITNLLFGGVSLSPGDNVLLFNQAAPKNNGIWTYNGPTDSMTRPSSIVTSTLKDAHVYVSEGKYAGKTFIQTLEVSHIRNSAQKWIEVDNEINLSTPLSYPIHTTSWSDSYGNERFIDVNTDIEFDYDIIAFMNYPTESKDIVSSLSGTNEIDNLKKYRDFIRNLRIAVITLGKSLYISSPKLAVDYGIVTGFESVPQMINTSGDAQSAAISPFESGEAAENYFDTHRNMKYHLATPLAGLTNRQTYIMTDFVTYSPDRTESDYHIKYAYRQFGLLEGDEFYIPGLTTLPETLNEQLPGYLHNQKGVSNLITFAPNQKVFGITITKLSNNVYDGSTSVANPYDDNITTIAFEYPVLGRGKVFVNCVENGYPFSRLDYNKARIQNVTAGQNAETTQTAAWQYSTRRLNKKNLYDFSEVSNLIGQTTPTNGGGGPAIQGQSHCSNGFIRNQIDKDNLTYQSDLYSEITEEYFQTTEIPVLSMTWLGLKWLAE